MESHTTSSNASSADAPEAQVPQVLQVGVDWYRDLVNHSQDLLCIHDLQGRLLSVNPAPARVLGYTVEEILQIPMRELIAPEFRLQFDAYLGEIQRNGEARGYLSVLTRYGERRIWQYQNTLRTEGVPAPVVRGMAHDVTEQKQAERALRASESRLRTIFEKSPVGVCLIDGRTGRFQKANPKFCEIAGRAEEDLLQCDVHHIFHPGDLPSTIDQMCPPFNGGPALECESRVLRPDGSIRWVKVLLAHMAAEQGASHMAIVQDTTESRQADIALRQSEARLRVALKNSALVVFHQDRDLRYTWLHNPVLAWAERDVIGKTDTEIIGEQAATRLTEIKKDVLDTGVGTRVEVPILHGGKQHYVDFTVEPLTDSAGLVTGLTCAASDITPLRELSQELRVAQEKLTEEKFYLEKEIDTELGFDEIIGKSEVLKTVLAQVIRVASSNSTVLLLGESGTGKELVARAVHRMSKRSKYPFIKMNCAAIPSGLLESELFGHERGAFTGAVTKKIGRLELADKGTLFLDEIGDACWLTRSRNNRTKSAFAWRWAHNGATLCGSF
jgi:PAS domain S-box-containing protein